MSLVTYLFQRLRLHLENLQSGLPLQSSIHLINMIHSLRRQLKKNPTPYKRNELSNKELDLQKEMLKAKNSMNILWIQLFDRIPSSCIPTFGSYGRPKLLHTRLSIILCQFITQQRKQKFLMNISILYSQEAITPFPQQKRFLPQTPSFPILLLPQLTYSKHWLT